MQSLVVLQIHLPFSHVFQELDVLQLDLGVWVRRLDYLQYMLLQVKYWYVARGAYKLRIQETFFVYLRSLCFLSYNKLNINRIFCLLIHFAFHIIGSLLKYRYLNLWLLLLTRWLALLNRITIDVTTIFPLSLPSNLLPLEDLPLLPMFLLDLLVLLHLHNRILLRLQHMHPLVEPLEVKLLDLLLPLLLLQSVVLVDVTH